jgi:hypothetical protein
MAKSVIAIVKGGLGNQLFIYAAARALALRGGRKLYLDTVRGYSADSFGRSYRLDRFPIDAESMPEEWRVAPALKHPWHKVVRAFSRFLPRDRRGYVAEKRGRGAEQLVDLASKRERVTLLGYWQDEAYFAGQAEAIRRELRPPAPVDERNLGLGEEMAGEESIFLHVRRVRYNPRLGADYYQAAIDLLRGGSPPRRFYVLGDDLEWPLANLNFHGDEVRYVDHNGGNEIADLWLMTRCRHAIVANSSFSWWGAWLGERREGRKVCFPEAPGWPIRAACGWTPVRNRLFTENSCAS